jgi:hypothetical protein
MVNKKNIPPRGTPPDGMFDWPQPEFEQLYNDAMDASFAALGRDVVFHLPPEKSISSGLAQAAIPAMQYNPFQGRAPRPAPNIISTTKEPAVEFVHRDVIYRAHIKHGPTDRDESGGVALDNDHVQLTTVIESLEHIKNAESATIDGLRFKFESIRTIGLQQARYIMSVWSRVNEQEGA